MNGRKVFLRLNVFPQTGLAALIVCAAFFCCGAVAGTFFSGLVSGGDGAVSYLLGLTSGGDAGGSVPGFFRLYCELAKYHLIVFLLGFSVLGVAGIPAVSFVRAFSLAFSVCLTVRVLGAQAITFALAAFGCCALITVPCFFILAVQAFCSSFRLFKFALISNGGERIYGTNYFLRFILCLAILAIAALAEKLLFSELLSQAANIM